MGDESQGSQPPDLAGYSSVEDLVKAYRASGDEGKRQKARADLLEQQTRQPIPQRDEYGRFAANDPAQRLNDMGVPVDALDQYVGRQVSQAIERAFAPIAQGIQARTQMVSQYSDYNKFESDVAQFVNADPNLSQRYQKMFASDPEGAMEYAYLKFGQSRKHEVLPNGNGEIRKEASIPSGRQSEGKANPSSTDETVAKGWERYQKTGDPVAYAKARLRQAIRSDFLD